MPQLQYNGQLIQIANNTNENAFATQWNKAYSYTTNAVVWKNSVLYQAKHSIAANTDWSSDDWEIFTLNTLNKNVVHLDGNIIHLDYKFVQGCNISLGDIGDEVTLDYNHNVSYVCMKIPVKKGDRLGLIGQGGSTSRLWAFVDNENIIRQVENASTYISTYKYVIAQQDGYFVYNSSSNNSDVVFSPYTARTVEFLSDDENVYIIDLLQYSIIEQYISMTDKAVGDTVDITAFTGSNTYNSIIIPVKTGDMIQVKGNSGNAPRLWCLTDSTYHIKDLSSANYYSDKLTTLYIDEDGYFIGSYQNNASTYYPEYNLIANNNRLLDIISKKFTDFTKNAYISLGQYVIEGMCTRCAVGTAITYSGNTSYRTLRFPCKQGDIFELNGAGGTNAPLYAFTNSNNIVTAVSTSNLSSQQRIRIYAPNDGWFIYNCYTTIAYDFDVRYFYNNIGSVNTVFNYDSYKKFDLNTISTNGKYVNLAYTVGDTVTEQITENENYSCVKIPVKSGDIIQMINVSSGNTPRLWCLTDSNNVVTAIAAASEYYSSYYTVVATADGYFYGNYKNYSGTAEYNFIAKQNRINEIIQQSYVTTKELTFVNDAVCIENHNFIEQRCVNTSGSTADLSTLVSNKNIRILIMNCNKGDKFIITGHGATAYRLWAFVDSVGNIVDKANAGIVMTNATVIAPITGKFVMQSYMYSAPTDYKLLTNNKDFCQNQLETTENSVVKLNKKLQPMVQFDKFYDIKNCESELESFDFSGNIREQVQDHFDSLVESNSDFMSKVDIFEETGISYPEYANYHTYMYKIEGDLEKMGNTNGRHPKKKIFIIAGVHGDELAAPVNTYLLAKNLCNVVDDTYFKLRSCCDFYIIPCVNGYGMEHVTRTNGNGVDINRNYPIAAWTESGSGTSQYTGSTAGSEAETQMVMAAFNLVKPDIAMDHHNYANTLYQLYAVCSTEEMSNVIYDVFTECSYTFIKNLPEYFGNKFQIFNNGNAPKVLASYESQTANRWFYEQGIIDGCTCEISNNINFRNGQTHTGDELKYDPVVWSVGEYTLRNMIVKMAQHNLEI